MACITKLETIKFIMYATNSAYTINEFVYLWDAYCREMETFLPMNFYLPCRFFFAQLWMRGNFPTISNHRMRFGAITIDM